MTKSTSLLGDQQSRVRTDVRLPPSLANQVGVICKKLGIPRNAFYALAACNQLVSFLPLLNAKKKNIMIEELSSLLQKILENKRNIS